MDKKLIKSDEMLQVLCDGFLISIAERKKKAREVIDVCRCYRTEKYYVINSSRKGHHGWVFELDHDASDFSFF